jgi:hypothetical protein
MCAETKILTGLLERRALDAAIKELADISDPVQAAERADFIAGHGYAALAALISALDTGDAQLRGGLGQVAVRLPREQTVAALRGAARAQDRPPQARLTALTILERFFDEQPDPAVLVGLQTWEEMALQSLAELAGAMAQDPLAILEYLTQLSEQPPEVPHMILQAVPAAPPSAALMTLLRMLAQDPNARLAEAALEQLGRLRLPAAARGLAALAESAPPAAAALAARGLRKLRLSGVRPDDDSSADDAPWYAPGRSWRALISPVDGSGAQLVWFVGQAPADTHALVLNVVIDEARGLIHASGAPDLALSELPPAGPTGSLYHLAMGQQAAPLLLLEAPLEAGCRALRAALALNWSTGTPTPLAYRLLSLPVWLAAPAEGAAPAEAAAASAAPADPVEPAATGRLLDHPVFWGWALPVEDELSLAKQHNADGDRVELVTRLARNRFTPGLVAAYRQRLGRMAEWLAVAGDAQAAALARAAAGQLAAAPPEESPFLRRLIEIGLQVVERSRRPRKGVSNTDTEHKFIL